MNDLPPPTAAPTAPAPDGARLALRTLGALAVSGDVEGERAAAIADLNGRPRALAVLLRLALADGPVSRDLLVDEFWGDRDPERARHSLADALSAIRRAFGRESISLRSSQLVFKPEPRLVVDAVEFTRAAQAGRVGEAVGLYGGAFLDGVFIERAPRFDQWAMQRRFALQEQFVGLAAREWQRLSTAGAHAAAASIALRWQSQAPHEPAAIRALLESLAAPGTASALRRALDAYTEHQRALAADDDTPDESVAAYAATLAARYEAMPAASNLVPADPTPRRTPTPADGLVGHAPPPTRSRRSPWLFVSAAGAVAVVGAALVAMRPTPPATPPWIVVAAPEAAGVDSAVVLAVGLATRTALESDGRVFVLPSARALELARLSEPDASTVTAQVAPTVARRSGSTAIVVPVLVQSGRRIRLAMRVMSTDGAVQVVQGADASEDSLLLSVDRLMSTVHARLPSRAASAPAPMPEVATRSLAALAVYSQGAEAHGAGAYDVAMAAYREATVLDTTFAAAYAAEGTLAYLLNRPDEGEKAFRRAEALLPRVPARDRAMIEASIAYAHDDFDAAIRSYQRWLSLRPYDRVVRARLGLTYLRAKQHVASAREFRRVLAEDSLDADSWINLAKALTHDPAQWDSAAAAMQRGLSLLPPRLTDVFTVQSFGNLLVLSGKPDSAAAVFRLLTTRDSSLAGRGYRWLGMLSLWEGHPGRATLDLQRAVALQDREPLSALRTHWLAALAADMRGDRAALEQACRAMAVLAQHPTLVEPRALWFAGIVMARAGRVADARAVLGLAQRRMVRASRSHRAAALLLAAEVAGASGETARALTLARGGAELDSSMIAHEGLALAYRRAGQLDSARALLRRIRDETPVFGWEGSLVQRFIDLSRATVEEDAGDRAAAQRLRQGVMADLASAEPAFRDWAATAGFLLRPATSRAAAP